MPYSIENPPDRIKSLPKHAQEIFISAFNSALKEYNGDEEKANKVAWAAVKEKYEKNPKTGEWEMKSEYNDSLYFYFTKSSVNTKTGEREWSATASDTYPDVYTEAMSLELFQSFIERFKKGKRIYLSLAHYPSLNGMAEVGEVRSLFIDGKKLKAKGVFSNNRLGYATYKAILEDIKQNRKKEERVRVSIGFYAYKYRVGDEVWEYGVSKNVLTPKPSQLKIYLDGELEHLAVTRVPANPRVDITLSELKERSNNEMITRKDDALSIVGSENEDLVNEIEQEIAKSVNKSDTNKLVTKSMEEVYTVLLESVLMKFSDIGQAKEEYKKLFYTINPDGEINEDELSNKISEMLSWMTSRSEAKADEVKNIEEAVKDDRIEESVVNKSEYPETPTVGWQPLGGAKTLQEALAYKELKKINDGVYKAYDLFGAIAYNILYNCDPEDVTQITEKLEALRKLVEDYKEILKPEILVKLSQAEENSVSEGVSNEVKPEDVKEKAVYSRLLETVEGVLKTAITLEKQERIQAFQNLLQTMADELRNIDTQLGQPSQSGVVEKAVTTEMLYQALGQVVVDLEKRIDNTVSQLSAQIAAMNELIQQSMVAKTAISAVQAPPPPQPLPQKSVQFVDPRLLQEKSSTGQPLSIKEIVRRTTFLPR